MSNPEWEDVEIDSYAFIPAAICFALCVLALLAEQKWKTTISSAVLFHSSIDDLKDAIRNIWSNISIVAALIGGLSISMLMSNPVQDMNIEFGYISQLYSLMCGFSFIFCLKAVIYGVVNLVYTEPLSKLNCSKYILSNPNSIGNTVSSTIFGLILLLVAMILWVLIQYKYAVTIVLGVFTLGMIAQFFKYMHNKAKWDPKNEEWMWPSLKEKDRPYWVTWGDHEGFIHLLTKTLILNKQEGENRPIRGSELSRMHSFALKDMNIYSRELDIDSKDLDNVNKMRSRIRSLSEDNTPRNKSPIVTAQNSENSEM